MKPPQPFEASTVDGVLTLTLDTPASSVNIFSVAAAKQLVSLLEHVTKENTRAVVLRSGKPRSFLNGVGLMLANAVKTEADAARLTEPVKEAYARLRALPVPTVAVIRGSCYGCGVELVSQCRHRIAIDVGDTEFYMTEIADYLFVPAFGATRDLPQLLGLRAATNFLLWGERLDARAAHELGLVDACFTPAEAPQATGAFVHEMIAGALDRRTARPDDFTALSRATRARIARLPPDHRAVYTDCFDLLERAALGGDDEATAKQREIEACGRSAMSAASKAAQGFFFVRQIADQRCRRGATEASRTHVVLDGLPALATRFVRRKVEDVRVSVDRRDEVVADATRRLVLARPDAEGFADAHVFETRPAEPLSTHAECLVYVPDTGATPTFVEVASSSEVGALVYLLVTRVGLRAVHSRARGRFATDALVDAVAVALDAAALGGADPRRAARALRDFGFIALPTALIRARVMPGAAILDVEASDEIAPDPFVVPTLLLSLFAWAKDALATGTLDHPSVVDVLARDLLGFPLGHGSLCRYLTVARVTEAAARVSSLPWLLGEPVRAAAEEHIAHGDDFYR